MRTPLFRTVLFLLFASHALAQGRVIDFFDPTSGIDYWAKGGYQLVWFEERKIDEQDAELRLTRHHLSFSFQPLQTERDRGAIWGEVDSDQFHTDARFPDTGELFPPALSRIDINLTYAHTFDRKWILMGFLGVFSASDRPFFSGHEIGHMAGMFLRAPQGRRDAWLFFLLYGNQRTELSYFPIPGGGYLFNPSENFQLLVGFPFCILTVQPLAFRVSYIPLTYFRAAAVMKFLIGSIYISFEWANRNYLLTGRSNLNEQLLCYEKDVTLGCWLLAGKHGSLRFSGGYAFDRYYFFGEHGGCKVPRDRRIQVIGGLFLSFELSLKV